MERGERWMAYSLMDEMIDEKIKEIKDLCRIGRINTPDFLHYLEVIEKGGDLIEFPAELKKSVTRWLPKPNMGDIGERYFMGVDIAHESDECKAVLYQKLPKGYKPIKVIWPMKREEPCPNCHETVSPCKCLRNKCIRCGKPVGNVTFTVCDECWDKPELKDGGSSFTV